MKPAAFLISPSTPSAQALRLRRFGLAAFSYALGVLMLALAWLVGVLPVSIALQAAGVFVLINLVIFAVFRSGLNLRFRDPSLTRLQMVIGISALMFVVYHMDVGRDVALFGCMFVFLFGIYRLDAREYTVVTLFTLAAYALVINLLMQFRPQAIHDARVEWMSWLMLACWLPLFTIIGGQTNTLRRRLRESEVRFRRLTEMSSDFYWETDAEHRITKRTENRRMPADAARVPEFPVGTRRWELPCVSPDALGWSKHRALLDAHLPFRDFEIARLRPDGVAYFVSISGDPVFSSTGTFLGYLGVGADITERKRAEETLRASEEKFAKAFRASPMFMSISTVDDGRYVDVNEGFLRATGHSREAIIGSTSKDIALWKNSEDRDRAIACLDKEGRISGFEAELCRKSGESMVCEIWAEPIVIENQACVIWITNDISERRRAEAARKQLEAQLRESQKMEALGTLAGGVAHDFNNALATILGNVELARQDVGPGHEALVSLDEVAKAARRAKDLVQQILAFGRRQNLDRRATSLALVVVESARLIRATLPGNVRLTVDCKAETPVVLADATQVKQILLNLCSNALHAMEGREAQSVLEIRLEAYTHHQASGDLPPGRYARLTVKDNGPGMDEATRSRIFEPFFTTKPVGKGTGLGLSVVHGIVRAHEAFMEVESRPGWGTAFRIHFPAVEAAVSTAAEAIPETAPARGEGKHVLYVDGEEAIIFLMQRLLQRQGYRVSGYTNPREAIAAARDNPGGFDLAVTDYNMPGMSGLAVASALHEIRADLPVLLASGYITEELRQKAPAAGVRELIYKPNTVEDLCEAVARFAGAQSGGAGPT